MINYYLTNHTFITIRSTASERIAVIVTVRLRTDRIKITDLGDGVRVTAITAIIKPLSFVGESHKVICKNKFTPQFRSQQTTVTSHESDLNYWTAGALNINRRNSMTDLLHLSSYTPASPKPFDQVCFIIYIYRCYSIGLVKLVFMSECPV